jgi:hypothetical protein
MVHLVTLKLAPPHNTLRHVRGLPVLENLAVDEAYGLVAISPKRNLYVIRVSGEIDRDSLLAVAEVHAVHADVRIAPFEPTAKRED